MLSNWIVSLALAAVVGILLWYWPSWLSARARKIEQIGVLADEFFEAIREATSGSKPLPNELENLAKLMVSTFGNPRMVRHLIWAAVRGKISREAEMPSPFARSILRELGRLPHDQRSAMVKAVAVALIASALNAGVLGWFFLTFMVPGARARAESVSVYVPEIARGTKLQLAA